MRVFVEAFLTQMYFVHALNNEGFMAVTNSKNTAIMSGWIGFAQFIVFIF